MKKKILILIGIIGIILPLKANALTGSVDLSCAKTTLKAGDSTTCTIKGNTSGEVSSVSLKVNVGENLTLTSVQVDSSWQGDGEGGNVELYTDSNKTGNFAIATFIIKAASIDNGADTSVSLANVVLSDASFTETPITVNPLSIRIPSKVNTLSSLEVNGTNISGFSADKTAYSMQVESETKNITIAADKTDSNSQVSGDTGNKTVAYGTNTYKVNVKSELGETKTYTITVTRPEVRELKKLTLNEEEIELKDGIYEYSYTVKNDITSINILAELKNEDKASFVTEYGNRKAEDLVVGANTILIKTKDADNEELVYTITVDRLNAEGVSVATTNKETTGIENPQTGSTISYIVIGSGILLVAGAFVISHRNKKMFKI